MKQATVLIPPQTSIGQRRKLFEKLDKLKMTYATEASGEDDVLTINFPDTANENEIMTVGVMIGQTCSTKLLPTAVK